MPEGPSIVIAKEQIAPFIGKKVLAVSGNSKTDIQRLEGKQLIDVRTWGKHLLLCFDGFIFRIHFLLFGTYRINESKTTPLRLGLVFTNGELNFYTVSIKMYNGPNWNGTGHGMTHSGKVIAVDGSGSATMISSKMGEYNVISHHPRDIPVSYGPTEPSYNFGGTELHLLRILDENI